MHGLKMVLGAFIALTLLGGAAAHAQDATAVLMKKADRHYGKRAEGKAADAVTAYEKVLAVDGKSVEARWKLSHTYYWIGMHAATDADRITAYEKGIRYAQDAIALDAKCAPCQFWLGVSYGKYGEVKGVMQSLGLVPSIKDAMNAVLKLDAKYEDNGPDRVLGRLYFRLPALKGGDNNKAIAHLKKACTESPTHLMNYTFLAEVLIAEGRDAEAKTALETAIKAAETTYPADKIPEMKEERENAKKMYKAKFGKLPEGVQ